jgi:positive regulator of sigma E activity
LDNWVIGTFAGIEAGIVIGLIIENKSLLIALFVALVYAVPLLILLLIYYFFTRKKFC